MLTYTLYFLFIIGLCYLCLAVHYQFILAAVYFLVKDPQREDNGKRLKYAVVVPAHNEELLISRLCENLLEVDYPAELCGIFIIADNCDDLTVDICKLYPVNVLKRNDPVFIGKGYALQWAFEQIDLEHFDAVLIVDADTTIDPTVFDELNKMINDGSKAIQCYIKIPNRYESWFTQLMFMSRTVNALLYHYPKYKLGLSCYLMGTGMCFRTDLVREKEWTAFTLSEDWEYFARLIEKGLKIDFAARAIVFQQESKSLQQATTQRLRWSKGRFCVVKNFGIPLLLRGLRYKNWVMADASLSLIFPNWSLQINLIIFALVISFFLPMGPVKQVSMILGIEMLGIQIVTLIIGAFLSKDMCAVFKAVLVSPAFLIWKCVIDILSMTGIYRGKNWIRTKRHLPK